VLHCAACCVQLQGLLVALEEGTVCLPHAHMSTHAKQRLYKSRRILMRTKQTTCTKTTSIESIQRRGLIVARRFLHTLCAFAGGKRQMGELARRRWRGRRPSPRHCAGNV
jgi:hypothetical protein